MPGMNQENNPVGVPQDHLVVPRPQASVPQSQRPPSPPSGKVPAPPKSGGLYRRPPLRAKTGCLKCRTRRKKCDEQKPVCGDCIRLHLSCVWPEGLNSSGQSASGSNLAYDDRSELSTATPIELPSVTKREYVAIKSRNTCSTVILSPPIRKSSLSSSGSSSPPLDSSESSTSPKTPDDIVILKSNKEQRHITTSLEQRTGTWQVPQDVGYQLSTQQHRSSILYRTIAPIHHARDSIESSLLDKAPEILNLLVCPTAASSCRDFTSIISVALHEPWIRDSMLAFNASIVATFQPERQLSLQASKFYHKAIVGLRHNIQVDSDDVQRQHMILVAVNFLGLLETLCSVDPDRPLVHFVASAKLLALLRQSPHITTWNLSSSKHTFFRIMVEDAVYNIACLAFFASLPTISHLASQINFSLLESYFPHYQADDGSFYTSHYSTSPFLGGRRDIYHLIFNMTHSSRSYLSPDIKSQRIAHFHRQLAAIESGITSYYDTNIPSEVREKYTTKYKMHVLCLRIWLCKWQDPRVCAGTRVIRELVDECLDFMLSKELLENMNPALCWVMGVLMCAVGEERKWVIVKEFVVRLRRIIDFGHAGRMWRVLEVVESIRGSGGTCGNSDGAEGNCVEVHDGLNLLLGAKGLFSCTLAPCT